MYLARDVVEVLSKTVHWTTIMHYKTKGIGSKIHNTIQQYTHNFCSKFGQETKSFNKLFPRKMPIYLLHQMLLALYKNNTLLHKNKGNFSTCIHVL